MYAFEYHRPTTVRQAIGALKKVSEPKLMAGGQTLLPTMKQRLASPENLIDLGAIDGMDKIELKGRTLHVGAMATHASVASSDVVKEAIPGLAALAGGIGDPHVRHRGTIGGSIANNDPAADYPAACLGIGATIHTNERKIAADDFFVDMFETALNENEIITKVSFPIPKRCAYQKFANPASRYAIVGVLVSKRGKEVRVAVTGAASSVFRWTEAEEVLSARYKSKSLDGLTLPADDMNADLHASAEYRAHLVGVMAKRAVDAS
ncbi:MAG: xanthine dehydrogenase family protein subunit M [Pseudomonadota bacterium]